jgi:hypothetical protein
VNRALAKKVLAVTAVTGAVVSNTALVARLLDYVSFDVGMLTAIVTGITASIAGGIYLLASLPRIEKDISSSENHCPSPHGNT